MSELNQIEQGCLRLYDEYTFGPRDLAYVFGLPESEVLEVLAMAKAKTWYQEALLGPSNVRFAG